MKSASVQHPNAVADCPATLFLVAAQCDRIAVGRELAAPLISGRPHDQSLVRRGIHADLLELTPPEKKEKIGIAQVRELLRIAQFSPVQGERKVCLIPESEALTVEAANALLKVLEEPPRNVAFVLLAEHAGDLLPTIVSRSRIVRVPPPTSYDAIERIESRGHSAEEAAWLVRIASREGEIDSFLDGTADIAELRARAIAVVSDADAASLIASALGKAPVLRTAALRDLLRRATLRDPELLTEGIRILASQTREAIFLFLQDLLGTCFDALREETADRRHPLPRITDRLSEARLGEMCQAIDEAHRALSLYCPAEALLLSLLLVLGGERHVN